MKRDYSKWCSVALITAIYVLAGVAGVLLFRYSVSALQCSPLLALFCADVLATVIVWAFGLLYENVSVYDPYWSVFPPVAFLLWACYTHTWSLPVVLLLIASFYWGWRLTRNWAITFKGIAHEDWRYTKYRSLHPLVFHAINLFGLNMMPTLVVFGAMLPGLKLYELPLTTDQSPITYCLLAIGFLVSLSAATIQLIADKQIHDFRAANPGKYCNVGLWKHGRHPNYFGEISFWWGIWIMYASLAGLDWFICGPIAMTAMFVGISIPLMEKRQLQNKPGYAEYRRQTRMLISFLFAIALTPSVMAQEDLQKGAEPFGGQKSFTVILENPITSVKNQYRSGTCWDYGTIGFFESEILRKTGKVYDLCEMFVANRDYMDCATHYVRMHGYSQFSQGGSCDDVLEVIRRYGICPEEAMPAPGSLVGDVLANFKEFMPELETMVSRIALKDAKAPMDHWQDSVLNIIERYIGRCPESFEYEGKTYTPKSFAESLGLNLDDYVSLTSYTHHPFGQWFVIEALYKWRLKPSYNIPLEQLMNILDEALDAGYTVAWGGDVTGGFTRTGLAMLPDSVRPTQQLRQEQWDDWRFTYDHVMLIYGKAVDEQGKPYYVVKNSWGPQGDYKGIWYMSRDYMMLNTTYLFLNRNALSEDFRKKLQ